MKQAIVLLSKALFRGLLIVVPVYFAVLLLLKGMKSVANLVSPFAQLLPDWVPAEEFLSLLLVLAICVAIGACVGTRIGQRVRNWIEKSVFERIPSYALFRSLTHQVAGQSRESAWKAALVEILAGAVYILDRQRVHPVDVPFTDAVKVVSRWGSGAKDLVAAMEKGGKPVGRKG